MYDKKIKILTKNKNVSDRYIVLISTCKVNEESLNYVICLRLHNHIVRRIKAVQLEVLNILNYPVYFGGN